MRFAPIGIVANPKLKRPVLAVLQGYGDNDSYSPTVASTGSATPSRFLSPGW